MSVKIKRSFYADMFGPTTGDRVRLARRGDGVTLELLEEGPRG